jgi:capping protein alpha
MADFDHVSNEEEKLQIAQHFLLSSPPGQFQEVLTDVRKLLSEGLLTDQLATGIARAFNSKTGRVVTAPSGYKAILCPQTEVDSTHYIDSHTAAVFGVDHLTLQTVPEGSQDSDIPNDSLIEKEKALRKLFKTYLKDAYPSEDTGFSVLSRQGSIFINISGEKTNLRNFWSGRITSNWVIAPTSPSFDSDGETNQEQVDVEGFSPFSMSISGDIKIHAHYFEDGNVQLESHRCFPATPLSSSFMEEGEGWALQAMYLNMNEETFRAMRRLMPVTR